MFCNICGKEMISDAKFCNMCGAKAVEIWDEVDQPMSNKKKITLIAGASLIGTILLFSIIFLILSLISYLH